MSRSAFACGPAFTSTPSVTAVETWHVTRAAYAQAGPCGDVALAWPLRSGRTALVVVDAAGHGAARAPFASAVADTIMTELVRGESPAAALGCADELVRRCAEQSPYAVAFAALLHPVLRTVVYASAGHDVAFALSDRGELRRLAPTAPMLGIPLAVNSCDAALSLSPTETLVIVSDGVADSRPAGSDDFFGAERIARTVARSLLEGGDPARALLHAACAHAGRQADDVAALVARIGAPAHGVFGPARHFRDRSRRAMTHARRMRRREH